jgi:hypothetical protein
MKGIPEEVLSRLAAARHSIRSGDAGHADAELIRIPTKFLAHPLVLEARFEYFAHLEQWDLALDVANILVAADLDSPKGWLYKAQCLEKMELVVEEYEALLSAVTLFPANVEIITRLRAACLRRRK